MQLQQARLAALESNNYNEDADASALLETYGDDLNVCQQMRAT
jgi:hypothetical protein